MGGTEVVLYSLLADSSLTPSRALVGNGFVCLGDSLSFSIGANGPGWPELTCALSGQRLRWLGSAAVGGNTLKMMLARLATDVLPLRPDVVSVLGGTGDITFVPETPFAESVETHQAIVRTLVGNNILPVVVCNPPQATSYYRARTVRWNNYLREFARLHKLPLLDFWALLVDPATSQLPPVYDIGDGIHPGQVAHQVMAAEALATLVPLVPPYSPVRALSSSDEDNLVSNPLLLSGSPVPVGFVVSGTSGMTGYTETVVNDSDFVGGRAFEWNFTSPSAAAGFRALGCPVVNVGPSAAVSAGDVLLLSVRLKVVTSTTPPGLNVGCRCNVTFVGPNVTLSLGTGMATPQAAGLFQWRVTVPAATTSLQFVALQAAVPVDRQLTSRAGEFGIYNLTKMGLA